MADLTTFPEEDKCEKTCEGIGAFKKASKTPKEVKQEQLKTAEANKSQSSASTPVAAVDSEGAVQSPPKDVYLPGLQPAPDGSVDWTPLADMTGTRPTVNKYSISRYSLNEWRNHNNAILNDECINQSNTVDYNAKTAIMRAFGTIDKEQLENENRLKQKAKDIFRWKTEVERAVKAITEEVELLEIDRQRLKGASRVLMLPESISKECLELRSNRAESDLVADAADTELIKETSLVREVRSKIKSTLIKIEEQLAIDKAAKHKIEYDWCDKTMAYNCEAMNINLSPKSNTIMFKPGATKFGDLSAPIEYWEFFCRETVQNCETVRQQSADLRSSLNAILINSGRTLRTQADKTDIALAETIAITSELCTKLEEQLRTTLQKIADMEELIDNLHNSIRKMDAAMKLAQTRLDNRNHSRPHGESVRDLPHVGLIGEVKKIHETVTSLIAQLRTTEIVRQDLLNKRIVLEKEIAAKRNTLCIDRERCGMIRSHYPSASELAGF